MKYQNFAIIFVLIVLPLSIVLSYYIQNQTDTLILQTTYQTKLNDSTYDAIAAYQINSLNTQRVSGESVKSYVLASVNTFFNTLTTNLGMSNASKSMVQNYVPAILFTTYDGYYIYSPTKTSKIAYNKKDGAAVLSEEQDVIYVNKKNSDEFAEKVDISSPTSINGKKSEDINQTDKYTTILDDAKQEKNYMLKPFIYYSAEYQKSNQYNVVASYTLDNYVTVYGYKKKDSNRDNENGFSHIFVTEDFSKSGYLIDTSKLEIKGDLLIKSMKRDVDNYVRGDAKNYKDLYNLAPENQENTKYFKVQADSPEAYNVINYLDFYKDQKYKDEFWISERSKDKPQNVRFQTGDDIIEDTLEIQKLINENLDKYGDKKFIDGNSFTDIEITYKVDNTEIPIKDLEAKEYYLKAYYFSKWIKNNLKDIKAKTVKQDYLDNLTEESKLAYSRFDGDETQIFDIGNDNNPELEESDFVQHKRKVIRNSIQYNLNTAISTFNDTYYNLEIAYRLPVLTENDWESVLNNVCMVSFMQGLPCGTERFNSYTVVKSNNNNTSVSLENMYFVANESFSDEKSEYHMIDCPELSINDGKGSTYYKADQSAEFKYDAANIITKVNKDNEDMIYCLYEDKSNKYYKIKMNELGDEIELGEEIAKPTQYLDTYYINASAIPDQKKYVQQTLSTEIDLTSSPCVNGKYKVYRYDHKNIGCYNCNISKNYTPCVKWYKGVLRRTYLTDDGDLLVETKLNDTSSWIYEKDGKKYTGTLTYSELINDGKLITKEELVLRRTAVYTYLAKIRNNLYKNNAYINQ